MFSAPLSLTSDTHFELPSYLHESGVDNTWAHANLAGRDIHSFLVAPCFDASGNLWVCDMPFGRIFRVTPTGEWDIIIKYDGWPSGLRFHQDGRLFVADYRHGILSLDISLRKMAPVVTHQLSQRFLGVCDLLFASNGDLYFSDQGQTGLHNATGGVYRLKAEGADFGDVQKLISNVPYPAGLALSANEQFLFVAAMHDNAVWRLPLVEGGVSRVNKFVQLSGGAGPYGLVIDHDDNLLVAHHGLGCVWIFDKRGEPKYRVDSSRGDYTTALTLDPADPRVVIITESQTGSILKAILPMY
ncbi:MAG: SMP-30/gluconolactonase/LRE family protein [Pseudomonadota bacterium]